METILAAILSLGFGIFGSVKVLGWNKKILKDLQATFKKFKLDKNMMYLNGFGELLGVGMLWFDNLRFAGALLLAFIALLATIFHFKFKDERNAAPAIIMFVLAAVLAYLVAN